MAGLLYVPGPVQSGDPLKVPALAVLSPGLGQPV